MAMELMQVRLPEGLIEEVDILVKKKMYSSKSDVIREALRKFIWEKQVGSVKNKGDSVKEIRAIRRFLSKVDPKCEGLKYV